jgi:hypothetical protein
MYGRSNSSLSRSSMGLLMRWWIIPEQILKLLKRVLMTGLW